MSSVSSSWDSRQEDGDVPWIALRDENSLSLRQFAVRVADRKAKEFEGEEDVED
jgi:hypothetical protein